MELLTLNGVRTTWHWSQSFRSYHASHKFFQLLFFKLPSLLPQKCKCISPCPPCSLLYAIRPSHIIDSCYSFAIIRGICNQYGVHFAYTSQRSTYVSALLLVHKLNTVRVAYRSEKRCTLTTYNTPEYLQLPRSGPRRLYGSAAPAAHQQLHHLTERATFSTKIITAVQCFTTCVVHEALSTCDSLLIPHGHMRACSHVESNLHESKSTPSEETIRIAYLSQLCLYQPSPL